MLLGILYIDFYHMFFIILVFLYILYAFQLIPYGFIRDMSAANMIGAKGLRGKSWPDLDMLPLGWLTDQGKRTKFI